MTQDGDYLFIVYNQGGPQLYYEARQENTAEDIMKGRRRGHVTILEEHPEFREKAIEGGGLLIVKGQIITAHFQSDVEDIARHYLTLDEFVAACENTGVQIMNGAYFNTRHGRSQYNKKEKN
jgi:hypothetical protein